MPVWHSVRLGGAIFVIISQPRYFVSHQQQQEQQGSNGNINSNGNTVHKPAPAVDTLCTPWTNTSTVYPGYSHVSGEGAYTGR